MFVSGTVISQEGEITELSLTCCPVRTVSFAGVVWCVRFLLVLRVLRQCYCAPAENRKDHFVTHRLITKVKIFLMFKERKKKTFLKTDNKRAASAG